MNLPFSETFPSCPAAAARPVLRFARRRARARAYFVSALLFILGVSSGALPERAAAASVTKGAEPPALDWVTVDGDTLTWSLLRGDRPLVMVFWATWCRTCKREWPKLKKIEARYRDADGAPAWATVAMEDDVRLVKKVARDRRLPGTILADRGDKNGKQLGIEFVPTVCVLDRSGRVAFFGSPNLSRIDALLRQFTSTGKDPTP